MKQGVVRVLLISGLCALCSCLSHQYQFVNISKSWTEARRYCRENYADLANIDNQEEMKALMEAVGSGYNGNAWIGCDDRYNWQWSLADRGFDSVGETEFRNWESGRPEHIGSQRHCAFMQITGTWFDVPCDASSSRRFICYDEGDAAQRYILIEEMKNWTEAQSYCRENHTDLASARNQTENQEIKQIIKLNTPRNSVTGNNSSTYPWIGLFRESWKWWSEQSNSSYCKCTTGQPDNAGGYYTCAALNVSDSWRWGEHDCNNMFPFFCYEDNLILVRENKSWDEALSFCRLHYRDLASVPTEEVQCWVKRRAQNASTAHVWLGLNYSCKLHFWFWLDGRIIGKEKEPRECGVKGAVQSREGQRWVTRQETEKLNFICNKCGGY
ncbi:hypothetical protein AAFF_G00040610 [Aldrovandia affinis]|uniref:C-type lectin domain-containing protein n=1 Tax=Aldrovandia affinis TaxID=143900 RepID=A0AAD7S330_9TELE|nr:hypothetical protein AAFF_G00040610 [Aldrovandia affinis]